MFLMSQRIIEINKYLNFVPVWNKGISFGMLSRFYEYKFFYDYSNYQAIFIISYFYGL